MDTTRYVMANRRAGKFRRDEKVASRVAMDAAFDAFESVSAVHDVSPEDRAARRVVVFNARPEEIESKRARLPTDTILEPVVARWPLEFLPEHLPPIDLKPGYRSTAASPPAPPPANPLPLTEQSFEVMVTGAGEALADAGVTLYILRPGNAQATAESRTDAIGRARFDAVGPGFVAAVVVTPPGGFWTMIQRGPPNGSTIDCLPLPTPAARNWWHAAVGIGQDAELPRGRGIRIGVIDTGLGPHPFLAHGRGLASFIDGQRKDGSAEAQDILHHGTHCAGIIAARPGAAGGYEGIAPDCEIVGARVFAPGHPANQADIALAIDALSKEEGCHLLNLSFGSADASEIEQDAIQDAFERGTLCFAAAGNTRSAITYPGAYPETVSVAALGLQGWGPAGTLASTRLPLRSDRFGARGLYLANFSAYGNDLGCAAPGVGILSPVPDRGGRAGLLGAMDGTSQACPAAVGTLAVILSRLPPEHYLSLPADETRSRAALAILNARCQDVGLAPSLQGRGVPFARVSIG